MRPLRTKLVVLAGAAALATPTGAWAQGAVDEQYRDPFAGGGGGSDTGEVAPDQDTAPSAPSSGSVPAAAPAPTAGELPRTGLPAGVVAAVGVALVAAGTTLRLRLH